MIINKIINYIKLNFNNKINLIIAKSIIIDNVYLLEFFLNTKLNMCLINFNIKLLNIHKLNDITNNDLKISLQSLIDNPKELLELINECLKPKDIKKKQFGEVFTPMLLVNEMLDKLPKEVWKNKDLKWLEPCCGMGNFPIAVYLRLIEGLKEEIKDVKERKKLILENMIYMSELNKNLTM